VFSNSTLKFSQNQAEDEEPAKDEEFENALYQVEKYREVLEKKKELERTIIFQKARIEAIENELEGAISALNEKDIELQNEQKKDK
jgi:hypothetical protein